MTKCKNCQKELSGNDQKKFCSSSCAAKINNIGRRRHGHEPNDCLLCGTKTKSIKRIYCSKRCSGIDSRSTDEHKRSMNVKYQAAYRTKKLEAHDKNANIQLIKEIYKYCPKGYQVDHIIPISKDGKHHEDNLQYLPAAINNSKSNHLNYDHKDHAIDPIKYIKEKRS